MMKLAYRVFVVTLALFMFSLAAFSQTVDPDKRSEKDDRNTAPTVGTGGTMGGPTGLFTVYDGQTLRKGEFTFSAAISNYDRDPGDVDITEVPVSFQIGVTNRFELFFNTDAYRGVKVNSRRNLSASYLPNSQLFINGAFRSGPAVILAPGTSGPLSNRAVFRPTGTQPFVQYPYVGGSSGTFGLQFPFFSGPLFGFPAGTNATMGPAVGSSGSTADNFPGIGSVYGSILPGVVLSTVTLLSPTGAPAGEAPGVFTLAPSYLPDAPFINRQYGTSAFSTYTVGGKWRWTDINNPIGAGIVAYYRFYGDNADDFAGFNMMQRGASPGSSRGDIGLTFFADARVKTWMNLSANVGYHYNGSVKGESAGGEFTLLDRGDEFLTAVAADFPVNKFFQPIIEFRSLRYVGGRTPNAFEQHPMDVIAGARVHITRWFGIGGAYRYNVNQQDRNSFDEDDTFTASVFVPCLQTQTQPLPSGTSGPGCVPTVINTTFTGVPTGFRTSSDPHGFIGQIWVGRRNKRQGDIINPPANVTALTLSDDTITGGCQPGFRPKEGQTCNESTMINVSTTAVDPDNDPLVYNYTVSGGRIVGSGKDVQWDLSGVGKGTYTITAGVDDGCGLCGQTQTKTITIAECECVQDCEACPTVSITGPAGITAPGQSMTFTANITGGDGLTINWSVSRGTITSGQGTPSIEVATTSADAGQTVVATVTLGGLNRGPDCSACVTEASESAPVDSIVPILVDEFGKLSNDEIRARLDSFFNELSNNPTDQGYIINYGTSREIAARERLITNHIRFRKADPARFTIVSGGDSTSGEPTTKLYRVPQGAKDPTP
jgi:hypothetical protein